MGSRSYTISTARRDPTQDPNVQALVAAQAATSRRFADAQVINVTRHLESLHNDFDPCGMQVAIGISVYEPVPQDGGVLIQRSDGLAPPMVLTRDPTAPAVRECERRWWTPAFALWTGGTLQFGSAAPNGLTNNRFSTGGVTGGIDFRVIDRLIVGAAVGYGTDRTTIGPDGTRSDGTIWSGMLYASSRPWANWFVDAFVGYGTLGFDNARWVGLDGTLVSGTRSGESWFGSLAVGPEMKYGALKWAPYVRADLMSARLNGYAEQGISNQALTFGAISFNSTAAVLGLRASYDIGTQWGVVSPMFRVEYKHALDGGFNQSMWYSDLGAGTTYILAHNAETRNLLNASIGLRASVGAGATVDLEYGTTASGSAASVQTLHGALRLAF